jgi:hypothetical protein
VAARLINKIPPLIQMSHVLTSLAGALVALAVTTARRGSWAYLLGPGTFTAGVVMAGIWNQAASLDYRVRGGNSDYLSEDSSDSESSDSILTYDVTRPRARDPEEARGDEIEAARQAEARARQIALIDEQLEREMRQREKRFRERELADSNERLKRKRRMDELAIIQFERRALEQSTAGSMLHDLHTAMVTFSSRRRQVTQSYNLSVSIGLAVERVLRPTLATYRHTLERSKLLISGVDDNEGLEALADVLREFSHLAVLWGYDWRGHVHTRYERRMHANPTDYGCTYYVSDVIFRNIARAAAGQGLSPNDGIVGPLGNNKWESTNFMAEPCSFDHVGGRGTRQLFSDFIAEAL